MARPQDVVGRFLRLAGQWLSDRGVPNTFIWVLEQVGSTGIHAHILLHVPKELRGEFSRRARHRWPTLSGIEVRKGVIYTSPPTEARCGDLDQGDTPKKRQSYRNQLAGVLRYMLKSVDPVAPSALVPGLGSVVDLLKITPKPSEPIFGRRCSRSQNIGATARTRYAEQRHRLVTGRTKLIGGKGALDNGYRQRPAEPS